MLWAREAADGFSIVSQSSAGTGGETCSGGDGLAFSGKERLAFSGGAWEVEDSGSEGSSEGEGGNIFLILLQHLFPKSVQRQRISQIKLTVTTAHKP